MLVGAILLPLSVKAMILSSEKLNSARIHIGDSHIR